MDLILIPSIVRSLPQIGRKVGVILGCAHARSVQILGDRGALLFRKTVHDARLAAVRLVNERGDLLEHGLASLALRNDRVIEIRPIEGRFEQDAALDAQNLLDIVDDILRGGGGQRNDGHLGEAVFENAELLVIGPVCECGENVERIPNKLTTLENIYTEMDSIRATGIPKVMAPVTRA